MTLIIRNAVAGDAGALCALLSQLGYPGAEAFMAGRLVQLLEHPDEVVLVAQTGEALAGFLSLHFIPQIGLAGDFGRVSYFCVDQDQRGRGVGKALLLEAEARSRQRGCDRMEVHCNERRVEAHRFYRRMQYDASPKYFIKPL